MSVYKTKAFARFARKARISDRELWSAAQSVHAGKIDADLGGGVVKQRIAREGEGKSGGSRSIIVFRFQHRAVFVYGFEKKDLGNIKTNELEALRELAKVLLGYSEAEIAQRVRERRCVDRDRAGRGESKCRRSHTVVRSLPLSTRRPQIYIKSAVSIVKRCANSMCFA